MKKTACVAAIALMASGLVAAADQGKAAGAPTPQQPIPKKTAWGHPNLQGIWGPAFVQSLGEDAPMLPENRKRYKALEGADDPIDSCKPPGVPRVMNLAFPFEILQTPKVVYILLEYDQHTRRIYLDGQHPKDLDPSWLGHSIGHWEGNTLVVETVGQNEDTWLDMRGHLHSQDMKLIERFTRSDDGKSLTYQIIIDDPKMYSKPWGMTKTHQLRPDLEINEFICETVR
jgi:hypothetical protein